MNAQRATKRTAIYTRVSTADQNPELQLREIQDYASRQGWEVVEIYQDVASGGKASRPGLSGNWTALAGPWSIA
jgi:DNA invertase Pin-like site-specific DNA recombinase